MHYREPLREPGLCIRSAQHRRRPRLTLRAYGARLSFTFLTLSVSDCGDVSVFDTQIDDESTTPVPTGADHGPRAFLPSTPFLRMQFPLPFPKLCCEHTIGGL